MSYLIGPQTKTNEILLTLFLFFIATMPLQLAAQSRWNNYFVAHFMTADITPLSTVDSLAAANDWHRTYHTPMIGHTEVIYGLPLHDHEYFLPPRPFDLYRLYS